MLSSKKRFWKETMRGKFPVLDSVNIPRNCPTCKRPQRATKQLKIARLPTILIIHLKRFHYAGPWRDKLNTFIDYPMQDLDLTKYVLGGPADLADSHSPQPEKAEKYLY